MIPRRKVTTYKGFWLDIFKGLISGMPDQDETIDLFRKIFSEYIGVKHTIFASSGRDAFILILKALGLKKGDEVIFPSYTLKNLAELTENAGFKPVFVPVSEDFNINPAEIKNKITERTRVIVATHLFGNPCRIGEIKSIALGRNIDIIEDCAHALGADIDGKRVGSFGRAAFFSFETRKIINTLGGGAITTNDDELFSHILKEFKKQRISKIHLIKKAFFCLVEQIVLLPAFWSFFARLLRNTTMKSIILKLYRAAHTTSRNSVYAYSGLQAYLGIKQLDNIEKYHRNRSFIAKLYNDNLDNSIIPLIGKSSRHAYYCYIIRIKDASIISSKLLEYGIDTGYGDEVMQVLDDNKATKVIHDQALELPMYKGLKIEDIKMIVRRINELLE